MLDCISGISPIPSDSTHENGQGALDSIHKTPLIPENHLNSLGLSRFFTTDKSCGSGNSYHP
jgi:hypothetical protein